MNKKLLAFAILSLQFTTAQHHHNHAEESNDERLASQGVFEDIHVKDRALTDWQGNWQSVYPYLLNGDLDEVFESKAANGDKTFDEYKQYYSIGYEGTVNFINIKGSSMEFDMGNQKASCEYDYSGHKILTYESGKKGVRYLFECNDKNSKAPKFIQFSDHIIAPKKSDHFHLYMGNSSHEELLKEMENWPTYYPASFNTDEIIDEMIGHDHAGAHEHGVSNLNIVIEDNLIELNLEGALSNFISFEYAPKNDEEINEVLSLSHKLQKSENLFFFSEKAQCSIQSIAAGSDVIDEKYLDINRTDLLIAHNHDETHGNLFLKLVWNCSKPTELSGLDVRLFEAFPNMEHIEVQMLTPNGQKSAELSEKMTKVKW